MIHNRYCRCNFCQTRDDHFGDYHNLRVAAAWNLGKVLQDLGLVSSKWKVRFSQLTALRQLTEEDLDNIVKMKYEGGTK